MRMERYRIFQKLIKFYLHTSMRNAREGIQCGSVRKRQNRKKRLLEDFKKN